ncbi:MAG: hypothetical protein GX660_00165 [Clostridiaceae bacterium]|nr:hypothetical protein [Clostridiaceae bacterium]
MEVNEKVNMSKRIKLGSVLIVFFLLLYVPSVLIWIYGKNVSTDIIRMGEIEVSTNTDAVLVRNEEVLYSKIDGKCIREIDEGGKIGVQSTVATILNKSSEQLLSDLNDIDLRIININKDKVSNKKVFSQDIMKIEDEIEEKLQTVISYGNNNNFSAVGKIKAEIDGLIRKKSTITGDSGVADIHLKALVNEKNAIQKKIQENTVKINSKSSGIISYIVDGYEDDLFPDKIKNLTFKELKNLLAADEKAGDNAIDSDKGIPVAKVIKDIDYYIVFAMNPKNSEELKADSDMKIRINDIDMVIDCSIFYKSPEIEGNNIVAVRVNKALSETAGFRKVSVDLIKSYYKGLKVPLGSLKNIDTVNMTAEIALVRANRARYKKVKIIGKNNEFAIIKEPDISFEGSVSLYSSYIVNPKNIEEGQIIN